ncbi:MAG: hypothetical protein HZA16_00280 [Nitrospirae bacterium]|nr:hypothetical protein [Nitrospirota bacterium]
MSENIFFDKKDLKYCGKDAIIGKTVRIRRPELVSVGDGSIIDDFTYISGEVEIGKYVHIAASCSLQASKSKITINDFAGIASGSRIFATSADFLNCSFDSATVPGDMAYGGISEDILIDEFVWIGANSVVLPGCRLPRGFAAGALSKLKRKLPYKKWHMLINDETGECVRRIGVNKMLSAARKLTGIEYEL